MNASEIERAYARDGFAFPIPVMSETEAFALCDHIEALETAFADRLDVERLLRYDPQYTLPFADTLMRHPGMLRIAEAMLGADLMVSNVNIFLKEPSSDDFVSWHQDLHYVGLDGEEFLTIWLALSDATVENGCMRFLPGSHREQLNHRDTVDADNMLTRGQVIDPPVDEAQGVDVVLRAGEASVHHGMIAHASEPNRSGDRRIGFAVRYLAPHLRQRVADRDFAVLVQGEDRYGHFESPPPPAADFDPAAVARYEAIAEARRRFLFSGAGVEPDR